MVTATSLSLYDELVGAIQDLEAGSLGDTPQAVSRRRDSLIARAEECTVAAFDRERPADLDAAHRTLYVLYQYSVWNPPAALTDLWIDVLTRVRRTLESGLRRYVARRRPRLETPGASADALARWFETLAIGDGVIEEPELGAYLREQATLEQLREIAAQRSLFYLREPDPWIYAVPTLAGTAKAGLIDLLLDEYGWGKYDRMHSTIFAGLMEMLELEPEIDHYRHHASWQFLATVNYQWMLALNAPMAKRLIGQVYLTEAGSPGAMQNYLAAWNRLGIMDPRVLEFYELHATADEDHKDVALNDVAVPVATSQPGAAVEVANGIVGGRIVEAEFAEHLLNRFQQGASSLARPL